MAPISAHRQAPLCFDPAAGKDIYEPEKIIAQRVAKGGIMQWQVKWKGYDAKDNTCFLTRRETRQTGAPDPNEGGGQVASAKARHKVRHADIRAQASAELSSVR